MDNALFPAEALPLFRPYSYKCMYCGRGGAKSWAAARLSSSRVAASYSSLALVKLKTPRVLAKPADGQGWSCGSGWWIAPKVGGGILVYLRLPLGGQPIGWPCLSMVKVALLWTLGAIHQPEPQDHP